MYFGRFLYKVDLGQHFTPYEVIDLVVRIVNPRFGDVALDPACGTADFLVGAKRVAFERHGTDMSPQLHGGRYGRHGGESFCLQYDLERGWIVQHHTAG